MYVCMSVCLGDVHSLHIVRCLDVQSYVGIYVGCMSCSGDVCGTYVWGMYICMSVCLGDVCGDVCGMYVGCMSRECTSVCLYVYVNCT